MLSFLLLGPFLLNLNMAATAQAKAPVRKPKPAVEEPNDLTRAEEAIQKNDFPTAVSLLRKVVEHEPKNYLAWFDLGFVLNRQGRTPDAIAAYRQSVEAKADVFESNLNLGLMLAREKNPEAVQFLRAATKLKPGDHVEEGQARAWLSLGHVLESSKPEEALEAYSRAAALTPKDIEPPLSAGLLRERTKDFAGAEADYKRVLAIDPNSSDATIGLVNLYMKSGRLGEAEPMLRQLVGGRPDDAGLHLQLGRVLATQGKKDDAMAEIEAALKISPNDTEAQRDLADLLVQAGKQAEAEKAFRALLANRPKDADLHYQLGETLLRQRRFAEAEQEFTTTVKLKPDLGEAYGSLAIAANENKNYPLAIKALEIRDRILKPTVIGVFLKATAYDHLHDFKQASVYYHQFLDEAKGQYPDQEWQARHRLVAIDPKHR